MEPSPIPEALKTTLLESMKRDINRLGEDLREANARNLFLESRVRDLVLKDLEHEGYPGIAHDMQVLINENVDLRQQLKAFEAAGNALETAIVRLQEKLEQKDAVIAALAAEDD